MRVTVTVLRQQVTTINNLLGLAPGEDGEIILYRAYGGNGVHKRNGLGVSSLLPCVPARETYNFLAGMITGIREVS